MLESSFRSISKRKTQDYSRLALQVPVAFIQQTHRPQCYAKHMTILRRFTFFLILLILGIPAHALVNAEPVPQSKFESDYPWMVALVRNDESGVCGGVLIAPDWVLTAAHCTALKKYVLVGNAVRKSARRIEVERAHRHPDFDPKTLQNDIGVMKLAEPLDLPLARLPTVQEARMMLLPDRQAILLGWGRNEQSRAMAPHLLEGGVQLKELRFGGSQIAVNYRGGGPCSRDSGGPLILKTPDGQALVAGVISATDGELCNKNGGLAVYTNVIVVDKFIKRFLIDEGSGFR